MFTHLVSITKFQIEKVFFLAVSKDDRNLIILRLCHQ